MIHRKNMTIAKFTFHKFSIFFFPTFLFRFYYIYWSGPPFRCIADRKVVVVVDVVVYQTSQQSFTSANHLEKIVKLQQTQKKREKEKELSIDPSTLIILRT